MIRLREMRRQVTLTRVLWAVFAYVGLLATVWLFIEIKGDGDPFAPVHVSLFTQQTEIAQGESLLVESMICNESSSDVIVGASSTWQDGFDVDPVIGPALRVPVEPGCTDGSFQLPVSRSLGAGREWTLILDVIVEQGSHTQAFTETIGPVRVLEATSAQRFQED